MVSSPSNPNEPGGATGEERSSRDLLAAFVHHRDEAAFECLVRRYGGMVFGVCRRVVGNEHDAADAFQAVFLLLAKKAAGLHSPEALGTWLYNVAYRVSLKARGVLFKRAARERQVSVMPEPAVESPVMFDDLSEVLDEELRALPAKHQKAIILCDLQGQSRKEAAAALRIAEGTLSSRLAHGRKKLAARLQRRGITVTATALAVALAQNTATAAVPSSLVMLSVKAAVPALTGQTAAGAASANAVTLVDSVLHAMFLAKIKAVFIALFGLCALVATVQVGAMLAQNQPDEIAEALATLTRLGARLRWETTRAGKHLVMVDLKRTKVRDEQVKALAVFKDLREVILSDTAVGDAGCAHLKDLRKLRALRLNGTRISDGGIKHLSGLANLEILTLGWTRVGDAAMKDVASLPKLRELDVRHTVVGDAGIEALTPLKNMHTLELGNTVLTDAGLEHLRAFPQLNTLRVENNAVSKKGLNAIAAAVSLVTLSLDGNQGVTDAGLEELKPLQRLLSLNLNGTQVTDAGLAQLAAFKQLQYLGLERTEVTGSGLVPSTLPRIRVLWLAKSKVTDTGLKNIASLSTLQDLHLHGTAVTDAGIAQLVPLRKLVVLSLERTGLTDEGIPTLLKFPGLRVLNLNSTKITDEGLKQLAKIPLLHWLAVHDVKMTDAGLKHLTSLNLETLWMSWTKVSEAGLKELSAFKRLGTLRLGGVPLTDDGVKYLLPLTSLHTLWLDWTKITDTGLKELTALKRLRELRLDGTAITAAGLKELASLPRLERIEAQRTQLTSTAANDVKTAPPRVTVETPAAAEPAPETRDAQRSFSWLLWIMGAAAAAALCGWLILMRRRLQWRAVTASAILIGSLAALAVIGPHLLGDAPPVVPPETGPQSAHILRGHTGPVHGLCFTPDKRRLVSASGWPGNDTSVRIWDLSTNTELYQIPAPGQVGALVLAADGRHVLAGAFGGLLYIDVETGQLVKQLGKVRQSCSHVCFAADGRHAYSASHDGLVRRWDLSTGAEVARVRVKGKWARFVGALPNRQILTADDNGLLQFWDETSGREVRRIDAGPMWLTAATLTANGKQLLLGNWNVNVWDLDSAKKIQIFQGHKGDVSTALSPDGKTMLSTGFDGTARLWDFESGELLDTVMAQEEFLFVGAFSRDGRRIAVAGGGRKEGNAFVGGTQHDIHLFDVQAPDAGPDSPSGNAAWLLWVAALLALAGMLSSAAMLVVYSRRRMSLTPGETGQPAPALGFTCSHCGKRLRAKADLAGKKIKCPGCTATMFVPTDQSSVEAGTRRG